MMVLAGMMRVIILLEFLLARVGLTRYGRFPIGKLVSH
jgi:hypothetical protein